jgi:hypothetical protein
VATGSTYVWWVWSGVCGCGTCRCWPRAVWGDGVVTDMKTIRKCRNSEQDVLGDTHWRGGGGSGKYYTGSDRSITKFYFVFLHSALWCWVTSTCHMFHLRNFVCVFQSVNRFCMGDVSVLHRIPTFSLWVMALDVSDNIDLQWCIMVPVNRHIELTVVARNPQKYSGKSEQVFLSKLSGTFKITFLGVFSVIYCLNPSSK